MRTLPQGAYDISIIHLYTLMYSLNVQQSASLVIRHHIITPSEPDDLLRLLLQLCTLRVDVFPLSSGRSGSVNGQVRSHTTTMKDRLVTFARRSPCTRVQPRSTRPSDQYQEAKHCCTG